MLSLNYKGSFRLPRLWQYQTVVGGPLLDYFPNQHQGIAATDIEGEFIVSAGVLPSGSPGCPPGNPLQISRIRMPATLATTNLDSAPKATEIIPRKTVMAPFKAYAPSNAQIRGMTFRDGKVYCNGGIFYDVSNARAANLCRLDADLTNETPMWQVAGAPELRKHSGALAAVPADWGGDYDLLRFSYWDQSAEFGPTIQMVNTNGPDKLALPWRTACLNDQSHAIAGRSNDDRYDGAACWSPVVPPPPPPPPPPTTEERVAETERRLNWMRDNQSFEPPIVPPEPPPLPPRLVLAACSKGTAPGHYGGPTPPAGNTTNGYDQRTPGSQGVHAYPYKAELFVYSWASLQAPNDPKTVAPIQRLNIPNFKWAAHAKVGGVTVQGNSLYIVEVGVAAATPGNVYEYVNVVHKYDLTWAD